MQHSKIISGIDIGSTKITTIVGQYYEAEDKFNIIAVSPIPAAGFRKGQIINLDQATQTIIQSVESAERMAGFPINTAFVSVAAPHIQSLNSQGVVAISGPNGEISATDVDRVIEAAKAISIPVGKEIIHIIPRKYTVDGQEGVIDPIGMTGIRLEVEAHIIIASSPALKNLHKCLEEIGINVQSLVYAGLPTAKACLTETEKELGVALIDIGGSYTTLTIYNESSPCYSSVIPIGGTNVTNDLAIGLRFSLEDAEKVKTKLVKVLENKKFEDEVELTQFGIASEDKRKLSLQTAVSGIIKPRLEEIFTIVYNEIVQSGFQNTIPAGVVITGGGALTVNTKDVAARIIPLPIRIAAPPKIGGLVDDILNPAYTNSVGLLMHGLHEDKKKPLIGGFKKSKISLPNIFSKFKSLIEPLLP